MEFKMRIAVLSAYSIRNISEFIPTDCTEILTNVPNLRDVHTHTHISYSSDVKALIEASDHVMILCPRGTRRMPSFLALCRRLCRSFEIVMIDP